MSRRRWKEAGERWPMLQQFLAHHFDTDRPATDGSDDVTLVQAIVDADVEMLRAILVEWRDFNDKAGWKPDIGAWLNDGFGVSIPFATELEARKFLNKAHDRMIETVRRETNTKWKP